MQREIKFRGQIVNSQKWVTGFYLESHDLHHSKSHTIFTDEYNPNFYTSRDSYTVKPETIGQFTGIKDNNGVDIYEGDIMHSEKYASGFNYLVVFHKGRFCLKCPNGGLTDFIPDTISVIGNIHQNKI